MDNEQRLEIGEPLSAAHFRLGILLRAITSAGVMDAGVVARKVAEIKGLLELASLKLGVAPADLTFRFGEPADQGKADDNGGEA